MSLSHRYHAEDAVRRCDKVATKRGFFSPKRRPFFSVEPDRHGVILAIAYERGKAATWVHSRINDGLDGYYCGAGLNDFEKVAEVFCQIAQGEEQAT